MFFKLPLHPVILHCFLQFFYRWVSSDIFSVASKDVWQQQQKISHKDKNIFNCLSTSSNYIKKNFSWKRERAKIETRSIIFNSFYFWTLFALLLCFCPIQSTRVLCVCYFFYIIKIHQSIFWSMKFFNFCAHEF